jgi:hypothetical protein
MQEIVTYLKHVGEFWSSLFGADTVAMKKIDQDTVDNLQLFVKDLLVRVDGLSIR